MKKLNIILLILLLPLLSLAQGHHGQGRIENQLSHEEMRAEKVAYLTNQIDLSISEAQKFWPVYNAFQKEMENNMNEMRNIMHSLKTDTNVLSEQELESKIDRLIELESEEASIRSNYHEKFKGVLPISKVAMLYRAEMGFRKHLLEKYRSKRNGGMQHPGPKPE